MTKERQKELAPLGKSIKTLIFEETVDYMIAHPEEVIKNIFIADLEQEGYFVGKLPIISPAQRYRLIPKEVMGDKDRLREALKSDKYIVTVSHIDQMNEPNQSFQQAIINKIQQKIKELEG